MTYQTAVSLITAPADMIHIGDYIFSTWRARVLRLQLKLIVAVVSSILIVLLQGNSLSVAWYLYQLQFSNMYFQFKSSSSVCLEAVFFLLLSCLILSLSVKTCHFVVIISLIGVKWLKVIKFLIWFSWIVSNTFINIWNIAAIKLFFFQNNS